MIIDHIDNIEAKEVTNPNAKNAFMKVLVSSKEGWDDYVMRVVEVKRHGYTPKHEHSWPHINYVIEGEGTLMIMGKETNLKAGSFAFVPAEKLHQYKNTGDKTFKFICIVPKEGHK